MRKKSLWKAAAVVMSVMLAGTAACAGKDTDAGNGAAPTVQAEEDGKTGEEKKPEETKPEEDKKKPEDGSDKNTPTQPPAGETGSAETVITPGKDASTAGDYTDITISDALKGKIAAVKAATPQTKDSKAVITLSDAGIEVNGEGCKVDKSTLKIKEAGTYTISGTLSDGMIYVNADEESEVVLILNGVAVQNKSGAALYCKKAAKVTIILADGTENVFSDGAVYVFDEGETEPDATIFAKHDLVISGNGALSVTANYKDGLKGKDALYLLGGTLTVNAADDGIVGRDLLYVADGAYTVTSKADALKSTNDKDAALGMIVIDGGSFVLSAEKDAIQAENMLFIQDGTFEIKTGKGADGAAVKAGENGFDRFGGFGRGQQQAQSSASEDSCKGLKASTAVVVRGGVFTIDTEDDAIHGNKNTYLLGGNFQVKTGDDAVHAEEALVIAGNPVISVTKSYEGLEAKTITIDGGTIDLVASDDGINAAGGADGSGFGGRGGMFSAGSGQLTINGGTVTVNAAGDGVDSNGNITMNGGTVVVYGPTNDGNGALDYDGSFALNGGSILCIGSSGMAQAASAAVSTQYSLAAALSQTAPSGSTVEIRIDGKTVFQTVSAKKFSYIVASSADFSKDAAATVLINGVENFSGALTSVVTNFGNAVGGFGFGGIGGGKGGRPGMGGMPDTGNSSDRGNMPDTGNTPEFPNMGDLPGFPNMGDMPDMGNLPEDGSWNPWGNRKDSDDANRNRQEKGQQRPDDVPDRNSPDGMV